MISEMRKILNFHRALFILLVGINGCVHAQSEVSEVVILDPSAEQEASSIWRTINDYSFLEKMGYEIVLPNHPIIDRLIEKSKQGTFSDQDYATVFQLTDSLFFDAEDYVAATSKIDEQRELIHAILGVIQDMKAAWDWEFKSFKKYKIRVTRFGTGGSYDPDSGEITLFADANGGFKRYQNPANTIVHEIVHIGMEYSLVQKFDLSHAEKEQLVDGFVYHLFKDQLPSYRIQAMGENRVTSLFSSSSQIKSLAQMLSQLKKNE